MFSEVEIEIFIVFKEQSWRKFFVLCFCQNEYNGIDNRK